MKKLLPLSCKKSVKSKMYKFCTKLVCFYYKCFFGVKYHGENNVPESGGALIIPNHISNNDPVVICGRIPHKLRFMAKKELFAVPGLKQLITLLGAFPIDRSVSDLGAVRASLSVLKSGGQMVMFPEGRRNKEITAKKIRPGALIIAHKAKVPIIPIYIDGKYRLFGKMDVYYGKPVSPEQINEVVSSASDDVENKNRIMSDFLYNIIIGAREEY